MECSILCERSTNATAFAAVKVSSRPIFIRKVGGGSFYVVSSDVSSSLAAKLRQIPKAASHDVPTLPKWGAGSYLIKQLFYVGRPLCHVVSRCFSHHKALSRNAVVVHFSVGIIYVGRLIPSKPKNNVQIWSTHARLMEILMGDKKFSGKFHKC